VAGASAGPLVCTRCGHDNPDDLDDPDDPDDPDEDETGKE
jgi:hypothetical protein